MTEKNPKKSEQVPLYCIFVFSLNYTFSYKGVGTFRMIDKKIVW